MSHDLIKLNLGCGSQTPDGWLNVDYALGAKLSKIPFFSFVNKKLKLFDLYWNENIFLHDITKRFPWNNESVDVIYSSHTLEHLTKEQGLFCLKECFRILKSGAVIRIVVPDLRMIIGDYLSGATRADDFVESLGVLCSAQRKGLKGKLVPLISFPHKCMYDTETLLAVMRASGFVCNKGEAFSSRIDDISCIELESRTHRAVIVEGVRA